jgi:SAM-dependent methyltransferase
MEGGQTRKTPVSIGASAGSDHLGVDMQGSTGLVPVERLERYWPYLLGGSFNTGRCPICETETLFVACGPYLRNDYRCIGCDSIPRWRAVMHRIECSYPDWRELAILEAAPGGAASKRLVRECRSYTGCQFFPEAELGSVVDGWRNENLESLTFESETFDLVVTQDVFEHVLRPEVAFSEIARVLQPDGAHVFTVPFNDTLPTERRVVVDRRAGLKHVKEPQYHDNPVDPGGSLVVTEWGRDLPEIVWQASGLFTTVYVTKDRALGLDGELLEVFVSRKRAAARTSST